eukprot:9885256-Heterocapsa_arctica.AAC.1
MNYDTNNYIGPPGGTIGRLPGEAASVVGTGMSASRTEDRKLLGLIERPMVWTRTSTVAVPDAHLPAA